MIDGGKVSNFFHNYELEEITRILNKIPQAQNAGNFQAYTNGFTKNDTIIYGLMHKLVISRIEKQLNIKLEVERGMHLKEFEPWTVHSDTYNLNENKLGFLIPLSVVGNNINKTHTVIFNEKIVKPQIGQVNDFSVLSKVRSVPESWYEEYCSHCNNNELDYLTFRDAYSWEYGALIYWDLNLIHCSDNFLKHGITEKTALVIFAKVVC